MGTIAWSELGLPTVPGDSRIEGLGVVGVTQGNIDDAKAVGGDPEFDLIDATSMGDKMHRYLLGLMR